MPVATVRVFKIDAAIRKPVAGPEFRDKHKRGRPKRERGRSKRERGGYVSEAAPRFGNLCVYEPSALRKKPSNSSEKTFRIAEKAFRFSEEAFALQTHFRKAFRIAASILKTRTVHDRYVNYSLV